MARNTDDRLKRTLLLCFIAVSIVLIIGMYATDLRAGADVAPAFYRGAPTVEPSIQGTVSGATRTHTGSGHAAPTAPSVDFEPPSSRYD